MATDLDMRLDGPMPVTIPRELFDFLMGSGEIDGTSFGDLNGHLPGRFWWRALLRTAEAQSPLEDASADLLEALQALFVSYKALADSGDAGNWYLEDQPVGKQALAALAYGKAPSRG